MERGAISLFSSFKTLRFLVAGLALIFFLGGLPQPALADPPPWARAVIQYVQKMRIFRDFGIRSESPSVIPRFETDADPSGLIATYQPDGPTFPYFNAFFQNLDAINGNGRTCFTCHRPQTGWSVSAADVQARFVASSGTDPIFRLVDGATCPNKDVSTLAARTEAYKLLTNKGLIRIALPMPPAAEFTLTSVNDPYACTTNPATGTDPVTGGPMLSVYRRPLPSTNLQFIPGLPSTIIPSAIMWDGREPSLESQAIDATLGHAQAVTAPTKSQLGQIVRFEKGIFTAQVWDNAAGFLTAAKATGGPVALSKWTIGTSTPDFNLYLPWLSQTQARLSIARGEDLFNGKVPAGRPPTLCAGCHNNSNVGNHSTGPFFSNLGIAGAGANPPLGLDTLDVSELPVFTFTCTATQQTFSVTDPGVALITGKCADIGKFKVPGLRGLASRAPYFHNGSAATLADVVNFYDIRFNLNFTSQDKVDLVNFMKTL